MKIEINKYYKTRDGRKAFVQYETNHNIVGHICADAGINNVTFWFMSGSFAAVDQHGKDLVAPWEDEQEEIDVSAMWVAVFDYIDGGYSMSTAYKTKEKLKEFLEPLEEECAIAIVTVKDWQAIQQGKRKLIAGEGL